MLERITKDTPEGDRWGHEFRYRLANGFLRPFDVVVDAACGTGYGSQFLNPTKVEYHGVDLYEADELLDHPDVHFHQEDLATWEPDFHFDIFVGFETIEHLKDYTHYLEVAKRAARWVILSAPVIPTKHVNHYHLHDFAPGELSNMFQDDRWMLYQGVQQPAEFSEIYVFKRR